MNENDILSRMVRDHCKIEKLLTKLDEDSKGEYLEMVKTFHLFEWELEKHIFVEEKAIFTLYAPEDVSEGYKMLPNLTKQHNVILNNLNNWRDDIKNKRIPRDIFSFKEYLIKHKNYEENEVYPRLDESMTEDQKKYIFNKIDQIIV